MLFGITRDTHGFAHLPPAGEAAILIGNWLAPIDPLLAAKSLPERVQIVADTRHRQERWATKLERTHSVVWLDVADSKACQSLAQRVAVEKLQLLVYVENRPSTTGGIMKIYPQLAQLVVQAGVPIYPLITSGSQFTLTASDRNGQPKRRRMTVKLTLLPAIAVPGDLGTDAAQSWVKHTLAEASLAAADLDAGLFERLLATAALHGRGKIVAEDTERRLTYGQLFTASLVLARHLRGRIAPGDTVSYLLPSACGGVIAFFALQALDAVPAMLNFTAGRRAVTSAATTAQSKIVITSRLFVKKGKLEELIEALEQAGQSILYLEDVRKELGFGAKLFGLFSKLSPTLAWRSLHRASKADKPAVILFTSGSEGAPKGVVLSHRNLLANLAQIGTIIAINGRDVFLNTLPLFHSSGLTGGTLLPLYSGGKSWLYPNPLAYQQIPDLAYRADATILFATDTFLSGYGRYADSYDFYRLRFAVAGAEKLRKETRQLWAERFGVPIYEGYGVTETAPVLAANTPMAARHGTVGRLVPGMEHKLVPVPGIEEGGELWVRGPNVMAGYLVADAPGELRAPEEGWHKTGDVVAIDDEGFVRIVGRAKRFAKIAGEMVSLPQVEDAVTAVWPDAAHAVVAITDARRGEQLVLLTTQPDATRDALVGPFKTGGLPELALPRKIIALETLPVLGSGKTDYVTLAEMAKQQLTEASAA